MHTTKRDAHSRIGFADKSRQNANFWMDFFIFDSKSTTRDMVCGFKMKINGKGGNIISLVTFFRITQNYDILCNNKMV